MSWTDADVAAPTKAWSDADVAPDSFLTKTRKAIQNVVEPALSVASGPFAMAGGNLAAIGGDIASNIMGTQKVTGDLARGVAHSLTFQPRNEGGQENLESFAKAYDASKLAGLPAADFNLARQASSAVSQVSPPIRSAVSRATGMVGEVPSVVAGAITSKSPKVFKEAYRAGQDRTIGTPETFNSNMRREVPVEQMLTDAQTGLVKMQEDASAAYRDAKTGWAADKTPLEFGPIDEAFNRLNESTKEKGHSLLGDSERRSVDNVAAVIKEWRDDPAMHNTLGLDALKRRIDAIYPEELSHRNAQRVITGARDAVKDTIVKQAPDYADAMKGYETTQSIINDIRQSLVGKDKASKDAAINKLLSLGKEKEFRRTQAENLKTETGVDLMQAASGQSLSELLPHGASGRLGILGIGLSAVHNPWLGAALPLTSPRLMGELAYGAGRVRGAFMPKARENAAALRNFKEYEARQPATPPLEIMSPGELPPSPMGGTIVGTGPNTGGVVNLSQPLDAGLPSEGMGPQAALRAGARDTTPQSPQMPAVEGNLMAPEMQTRYLGEIMDAMNRGDMELANRLEAEFQAKQAALQTQSPHPAHNLLYEPFRQRADMPPPPSGGSAFADALRNFRGAE